MEIGRSRLPNDIIPMGRCQKGYSASKYKTVNMHKHDRKGKLVIKSGKIIENEE